MKLFYSIICLFTILCNTGCASKCDNPDTTENRIPTIYPDYTLVTFPVNIAPPNFIITEEGDSYQTEFGYDDKTMFTYLNTKDEVLIPIKKWKTLLSEAAGKDIFFRISIKKDGKWTRYQDIKNHISTNSIDPYVAYRLLYPGYELWNEMGIYQRNLTNYDETPIVENTSFGKQCVNCHTFNKNSPETMMMHIRGANGGTVISKGTNIEKVNIKLKGLNNGATYAAWHPSGRFIAFSANEVQQFFHSSGRKPIEVADLAADMMIYDTETHQSFSDSTLTTKEYMETFPNWSPDGKYLYFCRGNAYRQDLPLDSIRYDLYRISFDADSRIFGTPECVFEASSIGKSVSFPRTSPDGRYLLFTMFDYGNFSIWHPESELCIIDLKDDTMRILDEVNSDDVESFHTWSSDGKWFVFSSKRLDGLWARPFFASFDSKTGKAGKPFLLPQEDPHFYDTFTKTYNLPELITKPVMNEKEILQSIQK